MSVQDRLAHLLLERDAEIEEITELLAAALDGKSALAVVEGPAGIGKTRMCQVARDSACERGVLVLAARGSEFEASVSFGIARQLLEGPLRRLKAAEREQIMIEAGASAASVLGAAQAGFSGEIGPEAAVQVMHGLFWTLASLARERSVLVCVDDAHWADPPSLRWLVYLVNRLAQLPMVILFGLRTDEPIDEPALAGVLGDSQTRTFRLRPLTARASARLVNVAFGGAAEDDFAASCHEVTGGNPFLLRELLLTLLAQEVEPTAERGHDVRHASPPSVSRFVGLRLERLGDDAVRLARAVSVLGSGALLDDAAMLAALQPDVAITAASKLIAAAILGEERDEGGELRLNFSHPVLRASVYGGIPLADRAQAHRAAAQRLAARGTDCTEVAPHVLAAGPADDPVAMAAVRDAGLRALEAGAPDLAARYLRFARDCERDGHDPHLTLHLGLAEARSGMPAAVEHLEEASDSLPDLRARAQAGAELALLQLISGSHAAVEATMDAAITAAAGVDRELALTLEATLVPLLRASVSTTPMRNARLKQLPRVSGQTPAERALLALVAGDDAATGARPVEAVRRLSQRAAAEGRLVTEDISATPSVGLAVALIFSDQLLQAERHLTTALENASRRGAMLSCALLSAWRSFARLRLGEVMRGLSDAETANRLSNDLGITLDRPFVIAAVANLLRERDQQTDASEMLEGFPLEDFIDAGSASVLLHSRGLSRIARGRMEDGLDDLLECGRHLTAWEAPNPIVLPWRSDAAIVMGALGEKADARGLAEEELALAQDYGAKSAIGIALHGCALLEPDAGKERRLRQSLSTLEGTQARLAYLRVQTSLGAALREAGRPEEARECLRRSLDEAEQRGAAALAARARSELVASGARPRRAAIRGVDALTPSERQIAEMAASGRSNREIAHALFLTVRTVEMHLTGAYRKLGIASRTQLVGVFG